MHPTHSLANGTLQNALDTLAHLAVRTEKRADVKELLAKTGLPEAWSGLAPETQQALTYGGVGAGLGLASSMASPEQRKNKWRNTLMGGMAGGAIGYGFGAMGKNPLSNAASTGGEGGASLKPGYVKSPSGTTYKLDPGKTTTKADSLLAKKYEDSLSPDYDPRSGYGLAHPFSIAALVRAVKKYPKGQDPGNASQNFSHFNEGRVAESANSATWLNQHMPDLGKSPDMKAKMQRILDQNRWSALHNKANTDPKGFMQDANKLRQGVGATRENIADPLEEVFRAGAKGEVERAPFSMLHGSPMVRPSGTAEFMNSLARRTRNYPKLSKFLSTPGKSVNMGTPSGLLRTVAKSAILPAATYYAESNLGPWLRRNMPGFGLKSQIDSRFGSIGSPVSAEEAYQQ